MECVRNVTPIVVLVQVVRDVIHVSQEPTSTSLRLVSQIVVLGTTRTSKHSNVLLVPPDVLSVEEPHHVISVIVLTTS